MHKGIKSSSLTLEDHTKHPSNTHQNIYIVLYINILMILDKFRHYEEDNTLLISTTVELYPEK